MTRRRLILLKVALMEVCAAQAALERAGESEAAEMVALIAMCIASKIHDSTPADAKEIPL